MYYVYIIKSINFSNQVYIGYTMNLVERIEKHNSGGSIYTAKYKPWELVMYLGFVDKSRAIEFEAYLKSGSGRAFAAKRFM